MDTEVKAEKDVWGLIIGDYVHALRSALDQLVWQLVTVANGISPKQDSDVSFPSSRATPPCSGIVPSSSGENSPSNKR
jgi:hypothetical protein